MLFACTHIILDKNMPQSLWVRFAVSKHMEPDATPMYVDTTWVHVRSLPAVYPHTYAYTHMYINASQG